ncbi:helicase C-terminal domain-containing protein [Candidatus Margulisiibacteriota bacterium]
MNAKDLTFIVVDVETTGLSPDQNEIIEIGIVKVEGLKITEQYSSLIKPVHHVPTFVQHLTGIKQEMLQDAPRFAAVADQVASFFTKDVIFVGHNVQFDFDMVNSALIKNGQRKLKCQLLDTQFLTSIFYPTLSSHRLKNIARALDIGSDTWHRAIGDALVTAQLAIKLCEKIAELPLELLHEINSLLLADPDPWPLKELFFEEERARGGIDSPGQTGWKQFLDSKLGKNQFKKQKAETFVPVSEEQLRGILDNAKTLKKVFPKYESRPEQKEMLALVCQAFNDWNHLIVEAGTGTGKSVAYLLPAAQLALSNSAPVVISTKTKNLQAQIMDKDIPAVQKLLGQDFNTVLMKGRENYLCQRKLESLLRNLKSRKLIPLLFWLYYTKEGDLSELHNSITGKYRKGLKSQHATCLGKRCPYHKYCFLSTLKKRAAQADVLIVNHSLLFVDASNDNYLLPEHDFLVLDEAHAIEDVATNCFSFEVSGKLISEELNRIVPQSDSIPLARELKDECKRSASNFDKVLRRFIVLHPPEKRIFNEEICQGKQWQRLLEMKDDLLERLFCLSAALRQLDLGSDNLNADLSGSISALDDYQNALFFVFEPEGNYLSWMEIKERMNPPDVKIVSSPREVSQLLDENLFSKKRSVVLTSATLSVNKSFTYTAERLGLNLNSEKTLVEAALGSPFDYQQQTLLCIPKDIPEPQDDQHFVPAIAEYINQLLDITKGKTLVLFTSYKMLTATYTLIEKSNHQGLMLLSQGKNVSRRHLLESFKRETNSVLFGTDSFWEGVDVPGISLSCVVIVKIPFFVPTDPLVIARTQAIEEKGGNGFYKYSIPHAVMRFKQGFGRLIRRKTDRGVVVILDKRLLSKNYGSLFLKSIPACESVFGPQKDTLQKIKEWF